MTKNNKLTIIVPTRERCETLPYTLKTCIAQNYDNLEILVSDNHSKDKTKEVLDSFDDERIKYINTGQRLCMSHNWEFALNHVTEGYVFFLGDDDGILPNAVNEINNLINDTNFKAINWRSDEFLWANHSNRNRAGLLKVSLNDKYHVYSGKEELQKTLKNDSTS